MYTRTSSRIVVLSHRALKGTSCSTLLTIGLTMSWNFTAVNGLVGSAVRIHHASVQENYCKPIFRNSIGRLFQKMQWNQHLMSVNTRLDRYPKRVLYVLVPCLSESLKATYRIICVIWRLM